MALAEFLDDQRTQTTASKVGTGALPDNMLARLKAAGVGKGWRVQVQEPGDGTINVQISFYPPPNVLV